MKTIVTGGAGFIGSHIVEDLIARGEEVKVIDNLSAGKKENLKNVWKKIGFVKGDIRNLSLLKKEFRNADAVFHEAALIQVAKSVENPLETNEANVDGTLKVLLAARDSGIKKVIFASSCAVYGEKERCGEQDKLDPKSPYAISKLIGEQYCKLFNQLYGIETVCLRYFNVYGKRQPSNTSYGAVVPNFISALKQGKQVTIFGDGKQTRDFVHVQDVARANILALKKGLIGVFNVGSGKSTSILDLYEIISDVLGKDAEGSERGAGPRFEAARKGDVRHISADMEKAIKVLGFKPIYSISNGVRDVLKVRLGE